MILPSMTYKEMYDHLAADKQKVDIKKDYLLHKAIKNLKKASRFPAWELYEYKIPASNNQYIIYFYAESRTRADKPEVSSYCILYNGKQKLVIKWGAGGYKHTPVSYTHLDVYKRQLPRRGVASCPCFRPIRPDRFSILPVACPKVPHL